jgi:hypothetical protein
LSIDNVFETTTLDDAPELMRQDILDLFSSYSLDDIESTIQYIKELGRS